MDPLYSVNWCPPRQEINFQIWRLSWPAAKGTLMAGWKSPSTLSIPRCVVMNGNKKGRSSYRSLRQAVFHPFCITCLLHYDFHQNTRVELLPSRRVIIESWRRDGRGGWKRMGRVWVPGSDRRENHSTLIGVRGNTERGGASYFLIKSVYPNGKFFYPFETLWKFPLEEFLSIRLSDTDETLA